MTAHDSPAFSTNSIVIVGFSIYRSACRRNREGDATTTTVWRRESMSILRRAGVVVGAAALALLLTSAPAFAGTGSTNPASPVPVLTTINDATGSESIPLSVHWTGLGTSGAPFILVCKKTVADPTFDYLADCAALTEYAGNPSDNP